jgi:hypothetical protein
MPEKKSRLSRLRFAANHAICINVKSEDSGKFYTCGRKSLHFTRKYEGVEALPVRIRKIGIKNAMSLAMTTHTESTGP